MLVLHGDMLDRQALIEAGIERADVFIAATDKDDRNVLACGLAKHLHEHRGGKREDLLTICRIRDETILDEQAHGGLAAWAEVDRAIDPIDGAISRLSSGIRASSFAEVIPFDHEAYLVELEITEDCRLPRRAFGRRRGGSRFSVPLLIGLKRKGTRSIVPSGTTVLRPGTVLRWPRRASAHLTTWSTPSDMMCALSRSAKGGRGRWIKAWPTHRRALA